MFYKFYQNWHFSHFYISKTKIAQLWGKQGKKVGGACLTKRNAEKFDGGGGLWYYWCDIIKGEVKNDRNKRWEKLHYREL